MDRARISTENISREVTDDDQDLYLEVIETELSPAQREAVVTPSHVFCNQDSVLAVHWHPEFIPLDLILKRVRAMFPNSDLDLIIPTQHNQIARLNGYAGVEVDCYSREFRRKVQLLVHFTESSLDRAEIFKSMVDHTHDYRSTQLNEFIDSVLEPSLAGRVERAAAATGAEEDLVEFARIYTRKLRHLIELNLARTPRIMLRNKLVQYYFDALRDQHGNRLIERVQVFLWHVKEIVKREFSLAHFYETREVIEEARASGGRVLVPHPEQFWPILLADYDVDGYEVWNPQSREYTDFLINVVTRENAHRGGDRPLLIFMGDDCHMGEKVRDPRFQNAEKAAREVGYQPGWDDPAICKSLALAGIDRRKVIKEYTERLN